MKSADKCAFIWLHWKSFYWHTSQKLTLFLALIDIDGQTGKVSYVDLGSVLESNIFQTFTRAPALNNLVGFFGKPEFRHGICVA